MNDQTLKGSARGQVGRTADRCCAGYNTANRCGVAGCVQRRNLATGVHRQRSVAVGGHTGHVTGGLNYCRAVGHIQCSRHAGIHVQHTTGFNREVACLSRCVVQRQGTGNVGHIANNRAAAGHCGTGSYNKGTHATAVVNIERTAVGIHRPG